MQFLKNTWNVYHLKVIQGKSEIRKGTLKHISNKPDIRLRGKTWTSLYEEFSPFVSKLDLRSTQLKGEDSSSVI